MTPGGSVLRQEKEKILENTAFLELKRKNEEVYFFSGKGECDFVIKENEKITEVIQVCYLLNESNRLREMEGLQEAMEYFRLEAGIILTH